MLRPCVKCGGELIAYLVGNYVECKCSVCGYKPNKLNEVIFPIVLNKMMIEKNSEVLK